MKFRFLPVLAVAAAGALVLTACSPNSSPGTNPSAAAVKDGTLNWALSTDPGNLFPQSTTYADSDQLLAFGYDSLITPANLREGRSARPWTGGPLVRLQVGLEDPADLIADLERGLDRMKPA